VIVEMLQADVDAGAPTNADAAKTSGMRRGEAP